MDLRLPDDTQRITIVGATGSGKTVAGVWHLSHADFLSKPWIIYDFKRDELLARIGELDGAYEIGLNELPSHPGLYFVHVHPDESEGVQEQMRLIWQKQNIGIFIDEGYMVSPSPNKRSWFRVLLTQGRSLHVPVIILTQRPAWLDKFVFTESEFYQVFRLNHSGDRKKIMEYVPADLSEPLPDYHSYYHDVGKHRTVVLKPVPTGDAIISTFEKRLEELTKKSRRVVI